MIWEIDDGKKEIEGLDEAGNPDPEYAAALGLRNAPLGRRAVASIIEFALYGLLSAPYLIWVLPYLINIMTGRLDLYGFTQHPRFILILLVWLFSFVLCTAFVIVQISLHGKKGVTIGKAMVGIRSVNVRTLEVPGFWRTALRALVMYAALLVPVIGPVLFFSSPFFDQQRRRRGWLDYVGKTWFVDVKHGLNPYDVKRMRIARKNAKAEFHEAEERLPSLATESHMGTETVPPPYVPSNRTSSGVLGVAVPQRSSSAPAPQAAVQRTAAASAPQAPPPAPAAPVQTPEPKPYRPGQLSGATLGAPTSAVPPEQGPISAPPPSAPPQPPAQSASPYAAPPPAASVPTFAPSSAPQAAPHMPQPVAPRPVSEDTVVAGSHHPALDDDIAATRIAGQRSRAIAVLVLDSGDRFELEGSALLGRNPRPDAGEQIAHALPVDDPEQSISKTHLLIAAEGERLFAVDRYSTNGSALERDGQIMPLSPGAPVEIRPGDIVRFGERTLQIQAS